MCYICTSTGPPIGIAPKLIVHVYIPDWAMSQEEVESYSECVVLLLCRRREREISPLISETYWKTHREIHFTHHSIRYYKHSMCVSRVCESGTWEKKNIPAFPWPVKILLVTYTVTWFEECTLYFAENKRQWLFAGSVTVIYYEYIIERHF